MAQKLTIFQNETNKDAATQFQQINLALQNIANWANRLQSSVLLTIANDSLDSTTSTKYQDITGYNSSFKAVSPLIRIDSSFSITVAGGGTGMISMLLDGAVQREVKVTGTDTKLVTFSDIITTYPGSHNIAYQWKTSAGTITKVLDGGTKIFITNLV